MNPGYLVRTVGAGRRVAVVGDVYRFLATGKETDGKYALIDATVPPGGGPPLHVHSREEEGFYVLEGAITFRVQEDDGNVKATVATPGMSVHLAPGSKHAFRNESDAPARMLILLAPAGLEEMFLEVGVSVKLGDKPPPPSKAEIDKLLAVAPRYGVEIKVPGH